VEGAVFGWGLGVVGGGVGMALPAPTAQPAAARAPSARFEYGPNWEGGAEFIAPRAPSALVLRTQAAADARINAARTSGSTKELQQAAAASQSEAGSLTTDTSVNLYVKWNRPTPGLEKTHDGKTFRVANEDAYISWLKDQYSAANKTLHPTTERWVRDFMQSKGPNGEFEVQWGRPGMHAEIQSVNDILNQLSPSNMTNTEVLQRVPERIDTATYRLTPEHSAGQPFVTCPHCDGILPPAVVKVLTGRRPR
jgi:hypothetical protein